MKDEHVGKASTAASAHMTIRQINLEEPIPPMSLLRSLFIRCDHVPLWDWPV